MQLPRNRLTSKKAAAFHPPEDIQIILGSRDSDGEEVATTDEDSGQDTEAEQFDAEASQPLCIEMMVSAEFLASVDLTREYCFDYLFNPLRMML